MSIDVAVSGDTIINRRVSVIGNERFRSVIEPLRRADVATTQLETPLFDYDEPGAYPAAEAGGAWMRSPPFVADELDWIGFDLVSNPSNHAMDYSYGGLRSTWRELDRVGIPYAGTGETLGDARTPTYLETGAGRVALVSMASSITPWSRAGDARPDMRGRPGNNPLRFRHAVDAETLELLKTAAKRLGYWITDAGNGRWEFNPSGLHNTVLTVEEADEVTTLPHERDLEGNCRAVRDAANQADVVIAHHHTHEFDPEGGVGEPPAFAETAARSLVDAGADIVVTQGSHSPMRGIELYDGQPIFYDPGDLFRMTDTFDRLPAGFYYRYADRLDEHPADATPSEAHMARKGSDGPDVDASYMGMVNPPGGYHTGSVLGNVVPVCSIADGDVEQIELHPGTFIDDPSIVEVGLPIRAEGETAERIIADIAAKSEAYDTTVRYEEGLGIVEV